MVKKTSYDNGFKFKVALAAIKGDKTYEEIATEFSISKSAISKWGDELIKNGSSVYGKEGKEQKSQAQEVVEQKLYQQIGQLTMEVDFLKKFASKYNLL
jgi:transposase-like protein